MENLKLALSEIKGQEFKVSNGKLNQVQRNSMKAEILAALGLDLPEGVLVGKCKEGLILEVANDNEGSISVVLDIKVKALDYDSKNVIESYEQDQAEKAEKAEARKRERAATFNNAQKKKAFIEAKEAK